MRKLRSNCCKKRNTGFTLVEMVITVSIFAILLGIIVPSLNSVLGFRVQRATNSITAALDKTRREAMNRLVGEMKLEYRSDGYYITYYLDRGKESESSSKIRSADSEKLLQPEQESVIRITMGIPIICGMELRTMAEVLSFSRMTAQQVDFFLFSQMNGDRMKF